MSKKDIINDWTSNSNWRILISKYKNMFGFKVNECEFLIGYLFYTIFECEDARIESRIVLLKQLNELLSVGLNLSNLKINWRVLYNFLEKYYLSNRT